MFANTSSKWAMNNQQGYIFSLESLLTSLEVVTRSYRDIPKLKQSKLRISLVELKEIFFCQESLGLNDPSVI